MAEFGICNFSEVSPSVFTPAAAKKSQQTTPTPPKSAKRRKARETSKTHSETKEEFVEPPTDAKTANDPDINKDNDDLTKENEVKVENNDRENETKPKFICINCQEGFGTQMSLNFHLTHCVPDDFFDEFPSEIVDSGGHGVRSGNKNSPKISAKHEPADKEPEHSNGIINSSNSTKDSQNPSQSLDDNKTSEKSVLLDENNNSVDSKMFKNDKTSLINNTLGKTFKDFRF